MDNSEIQPVQESEFKNIFDVALSDKNDDEFNELVDSIGINSIIQLVEKINYNNEDKEILISKAINHTFKSFIIEPKPKIEYAFGCRDPTTQKNQWNRAFVVAKSKNQNIIMCLFENGMDYIGHPLTYENALISYNNYINEGWKPMDIDDLEKTAGITIDKDTKTDPYWKNNRIRKIIIGCFGISITAAIFKIINLCRLL